MTSFRCTDEDGSYDLIVEAYTAKEAATIWAENTFSRRDYDLHPVCVVWNGNSCERYEIDTRSEPVFFAEKAKP